MNRVHVTLGLAAPAAPGTARADAIDGNGCSADRRHMVIAGPCPTAPGGAEIAGLCDRHGHLYAVPADEPHVGAEVVIDPVDENTVHVRMRGAEFGDRPSAPEVWKRCELTN